jgi:MFS family permease
MTLAHETEPLLANTVRDVPQSQSLNSKKLVVSIICATMLLATDFGFFMAQAPQTAIFEEIICRNHGLRSRDAATIDGVDPCKSELVQGELALILGWKDTFDVLPGEFGVRQFRVFPVLTVDCVGILLSLPFGILSDHWGRKPVLKLSVLGLALSETWLRVVCK